MARKVKKYPCWDKMMTVAEISHDERCIVPYNILAQRIHNKTLPTPELCATTPKMNNKPVNYKSNKRVQRHLERLKREEKLKQKEAEQQRERERVKKIMAVPVNPLKDVYLAMAVGVVL